MTVSEKAGKNDDLLHLFDQAAHSEKKPSKKRTASMGSQSGLKEERPTSAARLLSRTRPSSQNGPGRPPSKTRSLGLFLPKHKIRASDITKNRI